MNAWEHLGSVAVVLSVMAAVTLLELAVPLFARPMTPGRRSANLAMTIQTLLVAFVLTTIAVLYVPIGSPGLLAALGMPAAVQIVVGVVALDFAFGWVAHWTMHAWPGLWKYHRVHHSDAFVDVTTSYRTHPVENAWRHLWMFGTVWALGVPAAALVAFRVLSAVNAVLEHANVRVPPTVDAVLSRVWVTPNMHKVHHSRDRAETDSNYGNLFALHDRLLGTFVPTERALSVTYGLDDVEPAAVRSFGRLLALPWRAV